MIYDSVERVYSVLGTNFATDLATLCTAKSIAQPAAVTRVKRIDANLHVALNGVLPVLCVYGQGATTQAALEQRRDNLSAISVDYLDRQTEANLPNLLAQAELAAEAILKSIDRMGQSTTGVWGAALQESSAVVTLGEYEEAPEGLYQRLLTVTFPVNDRDEV